MLNMKTLKNPLVTDESKDGFCFRSSCSQNLKTAALAKEMADWNSSFTEADYLGMLSVMETIVVKYLAKGYSVIYDSVINTLRSIEKEHFSREHSSDAIDRVMDCDLLILDDLGTEYETAFYNSTVYNIINTRLNSGKPTMISTNLDFKGISRRYDERVVSRIISTYKCLEFTGEDVRLQKIKEK